MVKVGFGGGLLFCRFLLNFLLLQAVLLQFLAALLGHLLTEVAQEIDSAFEHGGLDALGLVVRPLIGCLDLGDDRLVGVMPCQQ
jgi:hypothetical protein